MNKKSNKKSSLVLSLVVAVLVLSTIMLFTRADTIVLVTDDADDVYCMTGTEWYAFWSSYVEEGEEINIETVDEFIDLFDDLNAEATGPYATPNCIDIIQVTLNTGDPNATLSITMEGEISDCSNVNIIGWSNCSGLGDGFAFSMTFAQVAGYSYGEFWVSDGSSSQVAGSIDGAEITWEFDNDLVSEEENCCMIIWAFTMTGDAEDLDNAQICWDWASSCGSQDSNSTTSDDSSSTPLPSSECPFSNAFDDNYASIDPITSFFRDFAKILFPNTCGNIAFIWLMIAIIVIGKVLLDRRQRWLFIPGIIILVIPMWPLISFGITISLTGDPYITWSWIGILYLITVVCLATFIPFQFANRWASRDDQIGLMAAAMILISMVAIGYVLPWYYYSCSGNHSFTLIINFVMMAVTLVGLLLTEKYSKGRLL